MVSRPASDDRVRVDSSNPSTEGSTDPSDSVTEYVNGAVPPEAGSNVAEFACPAVHAKSAADTDGAAATVTEKS